MAKESRLSDHCVVDHFAKGGPSRPPFTPVWLLRMPLMMMDKTLHFTGARGTAWRVLGVSRSSKNPNICNV